MGAGEENLQTFLFKGRGQRVWVTWLTDQPINSQVMHAIARENKQSAWRYKTKQKQDLLLHTVVTLSTLSSSSHASPLTSGASGWTPRWCSSSTASGRTPRARSPPGSATSPRASERYGLRAVAFGRAAMMCRRGREMFFPCRFFRRF